MFNVGFYLVVPFLATFMTQSLGASGAMVGLVLGLRTFSQQGLFFLGGGLTDRFGVRPVLLTGIAIRVLGFLIAASADSTVHLMIGVILIGFAAALFSPAAEAALATTGRDTERAGSTTRAEVFAFDTFFSRTGALLGPVLGALLIDIGFDVTCWVAAGIFSLLFLAHLLLIPAVRTGTATPLLRGWSTVLRNRVFLIFALAYSTYLVSYNQQYLALPTELTRARGHQEDLGWMFVYSSVLILLLQIPLGRRAQRMPRQRSLGAGFALTAAGFLLLAVAAVFPPPPGLWSLAPAVTMLTLMHLGQMLAVPVARDFVGILAGERNLGAYFGFLNTFGGLAVLGSSLFLGHLLDAATTPQPQAALPWFLLSLISASSALVLVALCRRVGAATGRP
nr:MFS transporter [Corynebacterium pacaense]